MSAEVSNVALTDGNARLKLLKPDGTALGTPLTFGSLGGFLEPRTLPVDGPYTLLVDPRLLATGSFSVQLFDVPADATVALTPDGAAAPLTTTTPGQNAAFTFTATAGVRYSVQLTGSSFGSAQVSWRKPDGTDLFSPSLTVSPLGTFLKARTLSVGGTYTIYVDPGFAETGSVTAQVFVVPPDLAGPITFGTPLQVAIAKPGQDAAYTFTGVKDRRVSLHLTNNTFERVQVSILRPDGTALFSPALTVLASEGFRDPVKLPVGGTYKVKVDPVDGATGAADVAVYDTTVDVAATIAPNATPVTVSTTSPGQKAVVSFTLTAARRVSLDVTGVTMANAATSGLSLKILRPDGTTLKSESLGTNGKFVDTQSLTQTGTYKIVLDPSSATVGSATLTLYTVAADTTAPILANGTPTTIAVATPGQNATLTFNGTANQRVAFRVSKGAVSSLKVSLDKGTTHIFFPTSVSSDPQFLDTKSLGTSAGSFKIVLDPQDKSTGSMTVTLWTVAADDTRAITPGSTTATLSIGQNARLTFNATAGQTATFTFSSGTITGVWARILGPTGTQLESSFWDSSVTNSPVSETLTQTGTYTFLLDPVGDKTGNTTFTLALS
jgi:hypothetical protein